MDIKPLIEGEMRHNHIVGAAVCIIKDGAIAWSEGFGWANIARHIPMTPDVMINIASITKTITATCLMQLWERGIFQLDDDINLYTPFPIRNPHYPNTPITFRQLLTHTSSLRDGPAYRNSYACGDPQVTLSDWLAGYLCPNGKDYSTEENFWPVPPGDRFHYSNIGFGVAGLLVETIGQTSFSNYCQKQIFDPLNMAHSTFSLANLAGSVHATPYQYGQVGMNALQGSREDDFIPLCLYSFPNFPDGLLRTSVNDLARFVLACLASSDEEPHPILQPATLDRMMTSELTDPSGQPIVQGLGWYAIKQNGQLIWGHGGADPGVRTQVYLNRPGKFALIVITNAEGNIDGILGHLAKAL